MSKRDRVIQLLMQGKSNAEIVREVENYSTYQVNSVRAAFEAGKLGVSDIEDDENKSGKTKSVKKKPDATALLMVSGRDELAQQLHLKNKAQVVAMPELLPIAMWISRERWGWPEYDIGTFIDVALYNLLDACDIVPGVALDRQAGKIITQYGEEELDYAPVRDEDVVGGDEPGYGETPFIVEDEIVEDEYELVPVFEPEQAQEMPEEEPVVDLSEEDIEIPWDIEPQQVPTGQPGTLDIPGEKPIEDILRRNILGDTLIE